MNDRGSVTIREVGPRDGLQNEPVLVSAEDKIRLIDLLSATGLRYIEATSFVSPKWVPQMADATQVLAGIRRRGEVTYSALVPNLKGYSAAHAAGVGEVAVFTSASETFSRRNTNCTIEDSLGRCAEVCAKAAEDRIPVRGYVSCVVACPYEGAIAPADVRRMVIALFAMGCWEVSLGDTIGAAAPADVATLLDSLLVDLPAGRLAGHFHDTRGRALECVEVSLSRGIRIFDASVAGAGGCPFAPGARGNVATGDLLELLDRKGFSTGVDAGLLRPATDHMTRILGRQT